MLVPQTTKQAVEAFENKAKPGSCLVLVTDVAGDYYTMQEFADGCGPETNRELVGLKRMDGSIVYFGELKQ